MNKQRFSQEWEGCLHSESPVLKHAPLTHRATHVIISVGAEQAFKSINTFNKENH